MPETTIETPKVNFDLSKFVISRILSNNTNRKVVSLLGTFSDLSEEKSGIIVFEKKAFSEEHLKAEEGYFSSSTQLKLHFLNDIYGNFDCIPNSDVNSEDSNQTLYYISFYHVFIFPGIKTTIIYPATDKHIQKFSVQDTHIIQETPSIYENITLPHLSHEQSQFSLDWVYNILDHKKEVDRIVFEDPCEQNGFVLLPDLKWDGKTLETFYSIAIIRRKGVKSLRDLTGEDLVLLKNIRDKGVKAIEGKFGLARSKLRIYFHYQPSFYHLHVHFTYLQHEAPGIFCEKSHLLDTVISNIELLSDYYQKATLSFVVSSTDTLWEKLNADNSNKQLKVSN